MERDLRKAPPHDILEAWQDYELQRDPDDNDEEYARRESLFE